MTHNNLGAAYSERIRGERAENLEQAIGHYQQALEVYTREAFPEQWAGTHNNLGNAYRSRIRGERAENLEQAIRHYEQALEVRTREAFPEQWATTHNNLGAAYGNRIRGERAENLEQAVRHYQQALEMYTREAFPQDWAMTHNNLGLAYGERIRGERAENLEQAIRHYQQALEVYKSETDPTNCRRTANSLSALRFEQARWKEAAAAGQRAIAADQRLYQAAMSSEGKRYELGVARDLYGRSAYALAQLGRCEEAAAVLESGRTRQLRETLENNRRDLERLPELGHRDRYDRYMVAGQKFQALLELEVMQGERHFAELEVAQRELQAAVEKIQAVPGYEYFLRSLPAQEIEALSQNAPLVYVLATTQGGLALIVQPDSVQPVWLPELTSKSLSEALLGKNQSSKWKVIWGLMAAGEKSSQARTGLNCWTRPPVGCGR